MEDLIVILTPIFLILLGYGVGAYLEKKHYESIRKREKRTLYLPVSTFGRTQKLPDVQDAQLFVGSVVISPDYFKTFVLGLQNLVGGRVVAYESLLDRGRREALLRLKEEAIAYGATQVLNVRYETSTVGGSTQGIVSIEVIAYGTGVK